MSPPTTPPTLKDDKKILKETLMKVIDSNETKLFLKLFPTIIRTHTRLAKEDYDKGFLLGQQSADDKWLKLIDDRLNYLKSNDLVGIGFEELEQLKSLSQNNSQDKLITEIPVKTAVDIGTCENYANPDTNNNICTCGHDYREHLDPYDYKTDSYHCRHHEETGLFEPLKKCSCKSFTPQPEKPEKERRGE